MIFRIACIPIAINKSQRALLPPNLLKTLTPATYDKAPVAEFIEDQPDASVNMLGGQVCAFSNGCDHVAH